MSKELGLTAQANGALRERTGPSLHSNECIQAQASIASAFWAQDSRLCTRERQSKLNTSHRTQASGLFTTKAAGNTGASTTAGPGRLPQPFYLVRNRGS